MAVIGSIVSCFHHASCITHVWSPCCVLGSTVGPSVLACLQCETDQGARWAIQTSGPAEFGFKHGWSARPGDGGAHIYIHTVSRPANAARTWATWHGTSHTPPVRFFSFSKQQTRLLACVCRREAVAPDVISIALWMSLFDVGNSKKRRYHLGCPSRLYMPSIFG